MFNILILASAITQENVNIDHQQQTIIVCQWSRYGDENRDRDEDGDDSIR